MNSLKNGAKNVALPFDLTIDGTMYHCTELLRLLPGKRLVIKAQCADGRQLVIKLFVKQKKGERELAREKYGYQLATQAGVNVPELVFTSDSDVQFCAIGYHYLDGAKPFSRKKKTLSMHADELLHIAAKLHNSGVIQSDFHLGNILIVKEALYLIDLASVKGRSQAIPLKKSDSLANLAMLVVQFKPRQQQLMINRLKQYYRARNWEFDEQTTIAFETYVEKAWQVRKTDYMKKGLRNCTMTVYKKTFSQQYAFRRKFFDKLDEQFIENIDDLIINGHILKAGNSATVVEVEYAGKRLVIKRYNIKSIWHLIKRCYRPSRAAVSWQNGRLLQLLGVATPKPLGFIEKRFGWFRERAYLICERGGGQDIATVYKYRAPTEDELSQLKQLFTTLKNYRISHGDLKATNLLIKKKGKIQLIDLDAMREHSNENDFQQTLAKDKRRFIANWQNTDTKMAVESLFM